MPLFMTGHVWTDILGHGKTTFSRELTAPRNPSVTGKKQGKNKPNKPRARDFVTPLSTPWRINEIVYFFPCCDQL